MTNILIASDSFKGSATSAEIADYLSEGILEADAAAVVQKVPIADGGEGTVRCVIQATNGQLMTQQVCGPSGNQLTATWGLIDPDTAILETAEAAGLTLVANGLDVAKATTYGVGQLISAALDQHVKTIYLGLGGSATNDGGVGMAQALGAHFYDQAGQELKPGAQYLEDLVDVDLTTLDPRLAQIKVIGLSDVNNPLIGERGASYIFGPQKGASIDQIKTLDQSLKNLATLVKQKSGLDFENDFGAGAAGGLGYGLMAFCHGEIKSGIKEVIRLVQLEEKMLDATLVVTGEGQIDGQSLGGKVPIGIAKLAKQHNIPVAAVVGSVGSGIEAVYDQGIDFILATTNRPMSVEQAIEQTPALVKQAGFTMMKAVRLGQTVQKECEYNGETRSQNAG
ncbi:glycerate kinase [Agrilactobacillus yilanensis]|uniref:Glycerate kinase n=1 Tax=Agrilactobacillus yilanensis TaxID=2485997 RepID=A0ABW4J622_9LACO|nr:glycerate kinase [Agrilactobacillus yilanensis]